MQSKTCKLNKPKINNHKKNLIWIDITSNSSGDAEYSLDDAQAEKPWDMSREETVQDGKGEQR